MGDYIKQTINYLPIKLDKHGTVTTPASEEIFKNVQQKDFIKGKGRHISHYYQKIYF